jgi:hypothetical protein
VPQFKTIQFPNTPRGQAQKIRALEREAAEGWRVLSETIVPGKFKGGQACCLFLIFAPCAFLAGSTDGVITVTLERSDGSTRPGPSPTQSLLAAPNQTFDRQKWAALLQYDEEIAASAERLRPLGPKWVDELASAYMALNDKSYLPQIVEKIESRANEENARKTPLAIEGRESLSSGREPNYMMICVFGAVILSVMILVVLLNLPSNSQNRVSPSQSTEASGAMNADPSVAAPPTVSTSPAQELPTPAVSPPPIQRSAAFQQGQKDRQTWEAWFGKLTGDYRAGAADWAARRSLAKPGSCNASPPSSGADRTAGCLAARAALAGPDARRKADPEYRLGWNGPL